MFELATEYLNEIITTEDYLINKKLILSKYSLREEIEKIFKIIFNIENNQLKNEINNDLSTKLTEKRINIIKKVLQQIKYNVNLELILDYFVIEMRNTHE